MTVQCGLCDNWIIEDDDFDEFEKGKLVVEVTGDKPVRHGRTVVAVSAVADDEDEDGNGAIEMGVSGDV